MIYDRNNILLASSIKTFSLGANPREIQDDNCSFTISLILEKILSIHRININKQLLKNKKFVWLKRNISPREHQEIINLGQVGLRTEIEEKRIYPLGNSTSHVVGFTRIDGVGLAGIEKGLENQLNNGKDIYLSIDSRLQESIREILIKTIDRYSADSGLSVVLDISTGEILSMNSYPDFDPNNSDKILTKNQFNSATQGVFEMGSTFKPITMAIGLDKNIVDFEMLFDVSKPIRFGKFTINDFKPYIYKTNDYGRQWKRIDRNLPDDAFVRVVREDPNRKGLLYAGTEKGIFVSFNDGQDWQSLVLNLPPVPITDLRIRQDNLIVATQGRAFWVLDDLFVIRQANENIGNKTLHVFTPKNTFMSSGRRGAQNFEGKNPSTDVQFYYYLKEEINDELTVDIFDSDNRIVRHFSSEESNHDKCKIGNMDPRSPFELKYPSKNQGLNSWGWNMKSEDIQCIDDIALFSGFGGPRIIPGEYHAKISIGEHEEVVSFVIEQDPRSISNSEDTAIWGNHLKSISGIMNEILSELQNLRNAKKQIQTLVEKYSSDERLQQMSSNAISNIDQWESLITQIKHQTLEDEDAWETMLAGQLRYLMDVIDRTGAPVTEGALTRLEYLSDSWSSLESELQNIVDNSIQPINDWAQEKNITHVYRSVN